MGDLLENENFTFTYRRIPKRLPHLPSGGDPADLEAYQFQTTWNRHQTAVLVVDMWDQHWCRGATERVKGLAIRMEKVLSQARNVGIQIIHCPSETMQFYKDYSQRARILKTVENHSRKQDPWIRLRWWEWPFPIDDRDGGCFCTPRCTEGMPWSRQIATIQIQDPDVISDDGWEIETFCHLKGITNLIYMGVHTNMCVLGRSFGIRHMVKAGFQVMLCRDLTDTMYNPARRPYVSHEDGTERVVRHIERYWCPSLLSEDLMI